MKKTHYIYSRIYQYKISIHVSKNVHKQFPSSIHLHFHSRSFEQKWHILLGTKWLNFIGWASKKLMSFQTPTRILLNVKRFGGGWVSTPLEKICERQIFPQVPTGGEKTLTTSCGDVEITMESTQLRLSTMETSLLQLVDAKRFFLRIAFGWLEVDLEEFFWKHEMRWSQGSCWCILATQSAFPGTKLSI